MKFQPRLQRTTMQPAELPVDLGMLPIESAHDFHWQRGIRILLALAMFLACCFPLSDTDLYWHLKTGELILDTWQIPLVDLYTFTNADRPWVDLHWGFQVLAAAVHRLGGAPLLVVVKASILTAAFTIGGMATGQGLPPWLRALPWCLALVTISGRGYERPEILSLLGLAAWLWLMQRIDKRPEWIWWLPVLQVAWINCHALFVLGLVVGGCRLIDEIVRQIARGRWGLAPASESLDLRRALYAGVLCGLAAFVNPYFEEGAFFPLVLFRAFSVDKAYYQHAIAEFQPPIEFFNRYGWQSVYLDAQIILWLVAAASFVWLAVGCRRWSPDRLLLFAGFSYLGWQASRNVNIFSLVAAVVACGNFAEGWSLRSRTSSVRVWTWLNAACVAMLAAFIVAVPAGWWHRFAGEYKSFGFGERPAWFPHAAARIAGQPGFPPFAFGAHFGVASVYTYYNGPDRKIFMDGRMEVCSHQTFAQFDGILTQMAHGDRSWEAALRDQEGRLPVILLDSRTSRPQINGLLTQPQWRLVFADPSCAVFLESSAAARLNLPVADYQPLLHPPGYGLSP